MEKDELVNKLESVGLVKKGNTEMSISSMADEFIGAIQVDSSVLRVPRLRLVQKQSGAFDQNNAKVGDFYCDLLNMNFGNSIQIIPIHVSQSASFIYDTNKQPKNVSVFNGKLPKPNDVVCKSNNLSTSIHGYKCNACPFEESYNDWSSGKPPLCKLSLDLTLVARLEDGSLTEPMVFSLRKTSYKAGKELVNKISRDPLKIPFGTAYVLISEIETNDAKQPYAVVSTAISMHHLSTDQVNEVYPIAKRVFNAIKQNEVHIQEDEIGF